MVGHDKPIASLSTCHLSILRWMAILLNLVKHISSYPSSKCVCLVYVRWFNLAGSSARVELRVMVVIGIIEIRYKEIVLYKISDIPLHALTLVTCRETEIASFGQPRKSLCLFGAPTP